MLNKTKLKEELEKERDDLLEQLKDMGSLDPETGEWEAIPDEQSNPESDLNDLADRFEDFESKSATIDVLESRLKQVLFALKNINKTSFGSCFVCKEEIEQDRLEANPSATTCKKHLDN